MVTHDMQFVPVLQESFPLYITLDTSLAFTTSNDEYINDTKLEIYPNPTSNQIIVESSGSTMTALTIYDLLGRDFPIQQEVISEERRRLNLSELPSGIYVVSIQIGDRWINQKIFKE